MELSVPERPLPKQYGLRSLFLATAAVAVLCGLFRGLGLTAWTSLFVAAVLVASLSAAVALVIVIARNAPKDDDPK